MKPKKKKENGLRTATFASLASAVISAVASYFVPAYGRASLDSALVGALIGFLIPFSLSGIAALAQGGAPFKKLPYAGYLVTISLLIAADTLVIYFIIGLLLFPANVFDQSQLILAGGLSAGISVTFSVANVLRQFIGGSVLANIFLGRYHHAKEEVRSFVFIDLVSSTALAESLGSSLFFRMINDFHSVVERATRANKGILYKYMGDGQILVWPGTLEGRTSAILACLEIQRELAELRERFESKYNHAADFTAGLHCGPVLIGEIGDERKEIGYWGDTVNTTQRIQSSCKTYHCSILASEAFMEQIQSLPATMSVAQNVPLRGKSNPVNLIRIESLTASETDSHS